ncbi:hypothetical protein ACWD6S_36220, partial [Streptomyces zhihengii]
MVPGAARRRGRRPAARPVRAAAGRRGPGGPVSAGRPAGLRDFYENPAVPVASGDARSSRQARLLAAALRGTT